MRASLDAAKALSPIGVPPMTCIGKAVLPRLCATPATEVPPPRKGAAANDDDDYDFRPGPDPTHAIAPLAVLLDGPFTEYHVSALMLAAYSGHEEVGGSIFMCGVCGVCWV